MKKSSLHFPLVDIHHSCCFICQVNSVVELFLLWNYNRR